MSSLDPQTQQVIDDLRLEPHPEGGFFREVYRSPMSIPPALLPPVYSASRALVTVIHFLLPAGQVSHFHRLRSDEIWFHHRGLPLRAYQLGTDGKWGENVLDGLSIPHLLFPKEVWFAAEPDGEAGFSLCSCLVAPGFDFADFELADADALVKVCPAREEVLRRLCLFPKR